MNNVISEIEQEFTDEQFLGLTEAFTKAYAEALQHYVEILIEGNKKQESSDHPKLNFNTLKAIAIITAENFESVNIKTEL